MPHGLALGLIASVAWGFTDLTAALAGHRVGSLRVLAGSQLVSAVLLTVIAVADSSRLSAAVVPGFAAGMVLGVGAAIAYLAAFTALRIGPLSVVSPVIAAYGGATVVLAVLLRGETLLGGQAAGAALATAGVVLAAVVFHGGSLRGARFIGPGVLVAFVALVLFALLTVGLAGPMQEHGWLPVALGSRLANTVTALVLLGLALRRRSSRLGGLVETTRRLDRRSIGLVAAVGATDLVAFVAYSVGLEVSQAWLVGLSSSFGPVIPLLYAVGVMGERLRPTQWLGLSMIAAGVLVLALAG